MLKLQVSASSLGFCNKLIFSLKHYWPHKQVRPQLKLLLALGKHHVMAVLACLTNLLLPGLFRKGQGPRPQLQIIQMLTAIQVLQLNLKGKSSQLCLNS